MIAAVELRNEIAALKSAADGIVEELGELSVDGVWEE